MPIQQGAFRNTGLEELFVNGRSRRIGQRYHANIILILDFLHAVTGPMDCRGVKDLHQLKGDRKGTYSMHVTGNYCITFKFEGENATDIDFEDYH